MKKKDIRNKEIEKIEQTSVYRDFGNGNTGYVYQDISQHYLIDKINELISAVNSLKEKK